jgi:hypothetical protein
VLHGGKSLASIIGRAQQAHQTASFGDRDTIGIGAILAVYGAA